MLGPREQALAGLLTLVGTSGGQLDSRIRLQKEAFLLAAKGTAAFDPRDFIFHHYGPYSRALSDLLHEAVANGLVRETKERFQGSVRYSYALTEAGREFLSAEHGNTDNTIALLAPKLHQCHWRALELAATVVFLERQDRHRIAYGRSEAFAEALKIKPDCRHHEKDAQRALEMVGV